MRLKVILLTIAVFTINLSPTISRAQSLNTATWEPDGNVSALAVDNSVIHMTGAFDYIGPRTGNGVIITSNGSTGLFPEVQGVVNAAVPDGSGGWYIAGTITRVGGLQRFNIAHVTGSGTVSTGFIPNVDGAINAMILRGNDLYIGGGFTTVNASTRMSLARINATTGALDAAFNVAVTGTINDMALNGSGDRLYIVGLFTQVGGVVRGNMAKINTTNNNVNGNFNRAADAEVLACALSGNNNNLYVGGRFSQIGNKNRASLAKIDVSTGGAKSGWNPGANASVHAVHLFGGRVYVGGSFSFIGGEWEYRVAALRTDNGKVIGGFHLTDISNGTIRSIDDDGSDLYVGGSSTLIGNEDRMGLAKVNTQGGVVSGWDPRANGNVNVVAVSGTTLFAGGNFVSVGGFERDQIGGLNIFPMGIGGTTIGMQFAGLTLLATGSELYVGNNGTIGAGTSLRTRAAQLSGGNFTISSLNLTISGTAVQAFAVDGTTLYLGGTFTSILGVSRNNLAAVDLSLPTPQLIDWDPDPNGAIRDIKVHNGIVYVAGGFSSIGGATRNGLAAIDADADASGWDPNVGGGSPNVLAISADGSDIYAAGVFSSVKGQSISNLVKLNNTDGTPAGSWNPAPDAIVQDIELAGSDLYVVGAFSSIAGSTQDFAAKLDAATAALSTWDPQPDAVVNAVEVSGTTVYLGGNFSTILGFPRVGLAAVTALPKQGRTFDGAEGPGASEGLQLQIAPNPIDRYGRLVFRLPQRAQATLELLDPLGQRVSLLFVGMAEAELDNLLTLDATQLPSGNYYLRLRADGRQLVRSLCIAH